MTSTRVDVSQPTFFDFLADQVSKNAVGFELGKLGENTRLRSRGEGHGAIDDVAVNDRTQSECFLPLFFDHTRVGECVSEA
jgi:hypothetical protein